MPKIHDVQIDQIDHQFLYLTVDGQQYQIAWQACSPRLAQASQNERSFIDIAPSGYGMHWPLLDEDLAIDPLLKHARLIVPQENNLAIAVNR